MEVGEKLWDGKGRITGTAVKSVGVEGISLESNFAAELKGAGRLQGIDFRDVGTIAGSVRPSGIFTASGQGFLTTTDGDTVIYKLSGASRIKGGLLKGPYLITFSTTSQKLLWMNGLVAVSEIESLTAQEYASEAHEWK